MRIQLTLLLALFPAMASAQDTSLLPPAIGRDIGIEVTKPKDIDRSGFVPNGVAPKATPTDTTVPFTIKCFRSNFTPFIINDEKGNVLFEIRCP